MAKADVEVVLEDIEELLALCDTAIEENENNPGFFEDVKARASDMESWISANNYATDKQHTAVRNWTRAIKESLE